MVQLAHPGVSPDVSPELIAKIPPIVDVDAHLVEPPDIWTPRLPAKFREAGPHVEYHPGGSIVLQGAGYIEAPGTEGPDVVWWNYEGTMTSLKRHIAASGFKPEEVTLTATTYDEIRPGCWKVPDRLADMDVNGVEAQLCFPNYPRFVGQIFLWGKDKELAELCVYAYNDWMVEEWCGQSGGRLLPLCIVPLWDAELAAAEIRRNAARGVRAVAFTEMPAYLELPSIHTGYWDPFFEACEETSTVICLHIGSGTKTLRTSADAPDAVPASLIFANSAASLVDFLFSGVLVRYPEPQAALRRGADRVDPVHARTRRRRVDHAPVERRAGALSGTAIHLLLPAGVQLLLQGPDRREDARPGRRRGARLLRDRLPALRQHLAALAARRRPRSSGS